MDKDQNKFKEQEAPEKNTDNAFVQVGKDGSPAIPKTESKEEKEEALAEQQRKEAMSERD